MKVTNKPGGYDSQTYVKDMTDPKKIELREPQSTGQGREIARGDTVSLSSASRDLQIAKAAASSYPEFRSEKVEALKAAINEGRYQINAEQIAEKMVGGNVSELA